MSTDPLQSRLLTDFERFGHDWPRDFAAHVRDTYRVNLSGRYLGEDVPHPVGKGSGQLSLSPAQLETDAAAGLAYSVLKTVVAEDSDGGRRMGAWATRESRMRVERRGSASGLSGWTVTWRGRGWGSTLASYLELVGAGRDLTRSRALLVVPSVTYHLPREDESFHEREYRHTTSALAATWGTSPLPLEVDFSPTLAADPLSSDPERILRWLHKIPARVRSAAPVPVRVALKLMNARFGDAFQVAMVRAATGADAIVAFNRLFDETRDVAYGGWDLSDRNFRVLDACRASGNLPSHVTGTGNVCSGRMILEYARRGCESVQVHTMFQWPVTQYAAQGGSRTARVLHLLMFHPVDGLVAGLLALHAAGALERRAGELHFLDVVASAHRAR